MKKNAVIALILALIFFLGMATGNLLTWKSVADRPETKAENEKTEAEEMPEAETSEPAAETLAREEGRLDQLKEMLVSECAGFEGEWSVYVEDLGSGESIVVNDKSLVAASLIKLFIMGSVYEEIEAGNIQKSEVEEDLRIMIQISDNQASNRLVAKLGGGEYTDIYGEAFQAGLVKVNDFAKSIGCSGTEQKRDLMGVRIHPVPEENYTTTADCGALLSRIYRNALVSEEYDAEMMNLLKNQQRRHKIPAGLPPEVQSANKTGELSDAEHDAAVVFSDTGDYILCVMSNNVPDTFAAQANISQISGMVYYYMSSVK